MCSASTCAIPTTAGWRFGTGARRSARALGADGKVAYVILAPKDVTEEMRREETVQLLTDHSPDKISRVDTEGVYRYVSPASEAITGWGGRGAAGRPVAEFWHPDDRPGVERIIDTLAAGEQMTTSSFRFRQRTAATSGWRRHRRPSATRVGGSSRSRARAATSPDAATWRTGCDARRRCTGR